MCTTLHNPFDHFHYSSTIHACSHTLHPVPVQLTGIWAINQIANKTHATHRTILIEQHTHYNYLFAFPRFATVPGYEHKAFIPFRGLVSNEKLPGEPKVVCGKVVDVKEGRVVVEKTVVGAEGEDAKAGEGKVGEKEREEIDFEYLVLATGTKLVPPGNVPTMGKMEGVRWFREHQAKVKRAKKVVLVGAGAVGVRAYFFSFFYFLVSATYPSCMSCRNGSRHQRLLSLQICNSDSLESAADESLPSETS